MANGDVILTLPTAASPSSTSLTLLLGFGVCESDILDGDACLMVNRKSNLLGPEAVLAEMDGVVGVVLCSSWLVDGPERLLPLADATSDVGGPRYPASWPVLSSQ